MCLYDKSEILWLAKYFIDGEALVLSDQVRGDLNRLWRLFLAFIKDNESLTKKLSAVGDLIPYLVQFNEVSGSALEWSRPLTSYRAGGDTSHVLQPRLLSVNMSKVWVLYGFENDDSLVSKRAVFEEPQESAVCVSTQIFRALDEPIYTTVKLRASDTSTGGNYHQDYYSLMQLLEKPTAQPQLSKARAKLKTTEKPFHGICSNPNHSKQIVSLVTKVRGHQQMLYAKGSSTDANDKLLQLIQEYQNMIPQELVSCSKQMVHYLPIVGFHTDPSLGDCSYLDTCHKMRTCRYLHYFTLSPTQDTHTQSSGRLTSSPDEESSLEYTVGESFSENVKEVLPAQWIKCDVRYLPFSVLGKFAAIISDPPWNIHMSLPYGTCKDHELLKLSMHELQDEGLILLWVTGRSIEIGRTALVQWGYRVANEMIWVKLNQLRRTIVTGRTGHWLNHSKEHLLVGVKGNPSWLNRLVDLDIIVSGTRETSRKPDEVYDLVERIVGKHARKLEMFGRDHNIRPGWLSMYFVNGCKNPFGMASTSDL